MGFEEAAREERAERFAKILSLLGYGVGVWALSFPRPYLLAVSAAFLVGLAGLWQLATNPRPNLVFVGENDPRASLAGAVFVVLAALFLRALDSALIDAKAPLLVAAGAGIGVFALLAGLRGLMDHSWGAVFGVALGAAVLTGAGSIIANETLDRSPSTLHEARVVARSASDTDPTVTVAGWAGMRRQRELSVDKRLHAESAPGTVVCARQYRGAFGWASAFTAEPCPVTKLKG